MTLIKRIVKGDKLTFAEMDGNLDYLESIGVPQNLVNDLTTGTTTKALSAEQGKILQDSKYPKLQNGTGNIASTQVLETLIGLGFNLIGANLSGANLSETNLIGANLTNAKLINVNLLGAALINSNLTNTDLTNANLSYTNLSNSSLIEADLYNANLTDTILAGANLTNVQGLNSNINIALGNINKDPFNDSITVWSLTWINGTIYRCNSATGVFTI